jgi:hypothetical protein
MRCQHINLNMADKLVETFSQNTSPREAPFMLETPLFLEVRDVMTVKSEYMSTGQLVDTQFLTFCAVLRYSQMPPVFSSLQWRDE